MPHLYFCCETECDAEAHVFGGRCDGCFEAEITYLRELHNPTRCPSYRPQTRAYLINEIQRIESMLEVDRSAKSRACYYETLQRLYEQMAASSDGRRNSVVSPRVEEKKSCADCGLDRKDDEPVLHCDWYCNPCWLVRFR